MFLMMLAWMPIISFAQYDDDMYFVPKKKSKTTQTVKPTNDEQRQPNGNVSSSNDEYYTGTLRDVDEYNRRGASSANAVSDVVYPEKARDTVYVVLENQNESYDDYAISARLARFHGYGYPYYSWYDPWYYDPWYYDSWYYGPRWSFSWGWGWGWRGYYGWYDPWYYGPSWGYYGGHGHHHHPIAGGGTPHRGFNGGRGYAMGTSPRGTTGATRGGGQPTTRTGRSGSTSLGSSRGYSIGTRSDRGASRGTIGAGRGSSSYYNSNVRGLTGSSSRSTVNNSSSRSTSTYRGSSTSTYRGSSSSSSRSSSGSYSGGTRGSSGSSRGGGFSSGGSRGGGFSGGGSRGGGGRR